MPASPNAIRAGKVAIEIFADGTAARKEMKRIGNEFKDFGRVLASIGAGIAAAGASIAAPLAAAVNLFSEAGSALHDMSARTGLSVESLSFLGYAAKQSGTEIEAVEAAIRKAQKTIVAAGNGSQEAADKLGTLGLRARDLVKLAPEQQFFAIAEGISAIENPTQRAAAALAIFGKSGTALLPLMADAEELRARFEELALTLTTGDAAAADRLGDSMDDLHATLRALSIAVGSSLAPEVTELASSASELVAQVTGWVRGNKDLVVSVAKAAAALVGVGGAITIVGGLLATFGAALAAIPKILTAVAVGIAAVKGAMVLLGATAAAVFASPIGFLAAMSAALLSVAAIAIYVNNRTHDLSTANAELLAKSDALRQSDNDRFSGLQSLSNQQGLSNKVLDEAARVAIQLQERYGDLGIRIDRVTGSVQVAADAWSKLTDAQRQNASREIQATINELQASIRDLTADIANVPDRVLPLEYWGGSDEESRIKATNQLVEERSKKFKDLADAMQRLKSLQGGNIAAIEGARPGTGSTLLPDGEEETRKQAQTEVDWAHRVHQLEIDLIEDKATRELAKIDEEYSFQERRAREAGATEEAIASIRQARALQVQRLESDLVREKADAEIRAAGEIQALRAEQEDNPYYRDIERIRARYGTEIELAKRAGDESRVRHLEQMQQIEEENAARAEAQRKREAEERIRVARQNQADSIAELELQATKQGYDLQKAMLDLQQRQRERDAAERGEKKEDIQYEFDLRRRILDQEKAAKASESKSLGSFGGIGLGQQFAAASESVRSAGRRLHGAPERAAENIRKAKDALNAPNIDNLNDIEQNTRVVADAVRRGKGFVFAG